MTGGEEPNARPPASDGQSRRTDLALLAVVMVVIVAAVFFRGSSTTDRGAPPAAGGRTQSPNAMQRAGGSLLAMPGTTADAKADLRNIVTFQEMYFADHIKYANDLAQLSADRSLELKSGTRIRIVWGGDTGWAAIAEGGGLGAGSCVVRIGAVPDSVRPRTKLEQRDAAEAVPTCDHDS